MFTGHQQSIIVSLVIDTAYTCLSMCLDFASLLSPYTTTTSSNCFGDSEYGLDS